MNNARRTVTNYFVSGLSILATILVILPLIAILFYLIYKGASSLNLAFFTHIPAPVGEEGGGMANSIVGSGIILASREPDGRSHRHCRRCLPCGVRPGQGLGNRGPLHRGCAQRRSLDRDGHLDLLAHRDAAEALLGACGRRRSRHHDDSHHHPDHRRDAGHRPARHPRSCARPRRPQVAHCDLRQPADSFAGHHHRLHAGLRACRRRDRAAALHRVRQSVLEPQAQRAHRGSAAADLRLRDLSL